MSFCWAGNTIQPHEALCADSCGRLAETERISGLTPNGTEVVDLVCHPCYAASLSAHARSSTWPRLRATWRALTAKATR